MTNHRQPRIILASSSPYRRELLGRLLTDFECLSPDIDETPLGDETAEQLVQRLALEKARKVIKDVAAKKDEPLIVIGSDQTALCSGRVLGKPGSVEAASEQLNRLSGQSVEFHTALALITPSSEQVKTIVTTVRFRDLDQDIIDNYLQREPATDCAGSFKSEGLGISLTLAIDSNDPTALIGLPLIELTRMLNHAGLKLP